MMRLQSRVIHSLDSNSAGVEMASDTASREHAHKIHMHVDNVTRLGEVFHASRARVDAALARRPEVATRIEVTIGYDNDGLEEQLGTVDVLFGWDIPLQRLAQRAPGLRWFHAHGAGINHLMPLDWLPAGAVLTNSRGVHGERATEYAAMAILMLNNRVPEMVTHQRQGRWGKFFNTHIGGKTLLIIGVGHIGGAVARWAKGTGLHVLGVRRTGKPHRYVDEMHRPEGLPALLPRADFVLMSAPHTAQSERMLGREQLALLKPGAGLLNYSRANLVDYDALREKLERREMSAVLDVFDPEPLPPTSPLWNTPNLIMTPHCSSDDSDYYTPRTLDLVMENMARFIAGKPLRNRVSHRLQY